MVHDRKMSDPVVIENTFELSAFMKAGVMATDSERDSGCSADEDSRSSLHSPTGSEDSVEMPVTPISLRNKRKLAEPRKIQEPTKIAAPLKKRRFDTLPEEMTTVDQQVDTRSMSKPSPFRPWIRMSKNTSKILTATTPPAASDTSITVSDTTTPVTPLTNEEEERGTNQRAKGSEKEEEKGQDDEMTQRLSIERLQCANGGHDRSVASSRRESHHRSVEAAATLTMSPTNDLPARLQNEPLSLVVRDEAPRVPAHPAVSGGTYEKAPSYMMDHLLGSLSSRNHSNHHHHHQVHQVHQAHQVSSSSSRHHHQGGQQRNYKNMTRERRIEANARERTRVHTISAAFDTLRRAIPAYSHNQKLSKLSVLRIACSYIMMLSHILDKDEDAPIEKENDLANCVDLVSKTIQTEGKLRKRKDD